MTKKEWGIIVLIVLLSNSITLFTVSKFLIPKTKTVDIVSLLEDQRRLDIQAVIEGKMTKEAFITKQKAISEKLHNSINQQDGLVLVKECVMGSSHEDITPIIKDALTK